jgi:hypothetical protein
MLAQSFITWQSCGPVDLDNDAVAAMLPPPAPGPPAVDHEDEEPHLVRARGQNVRDALRLNMPPV